MSYTNKLTELLRKKINEEIAREIQGLANSGAQDFSDYKYRTGKLQGLGMLETLIQEATTDIERGE